jgi:hypothetical protein
MKWRMTIGDLHWRSSSWCQFHINVAKVGPTADWVLWVKRPLSVIV